MDNKTKPFTDNSNPNISILTDNNSSNLLTINNLNHPKNILLQILMSAILLIPKPNQNSQENCLVDIAEEIPLLNL